MTCPNFRQVCLLFLNMYLVLLLNIIYGCSEKTRKCREFRRKRSKKIFIIIDLNYFYIHSIYVIILLFIQCRFFSCIFITFGAISLYTSGNIDLATSLYLIVHRTVQLLMEHPTYSCCCGCQLVVVVLLSSWV